VTKGGKRGGSLELGMTIQTKFVVVCRRGLFSPYFFVGLFIDKVYL